MSMLTPSDPSVKRVTIATEPTTQEIKPDNAHGKIASKLNAQVEHKSTSKVAKDAGPRIDNVVKPALSSIPVITSQPDPNKEPINASKEVPKKSLLSRMSQSNLASTILKKPNNTNSDPTPNSETSGNVKPKVSWNLPEQAGGKEPNTHPPKLNFGGVLTQQQQHDIEDGLKKAEPVRIREDKDILVKNPTQANLDILTKQSALKKAGNLFTGLIKSNEGLNLIQAGASGKSISPGEYLKAAEKLLNDSENRVPEDFTVMSLLYEKAAEGFMEAGKPEEAFKARAASAQAFEFSESHPLHNMTKGIDEGLNRQVIRDVGLHMESGSSRVESLAFATRPHIDGKDRNVLFSQLTTASRMEFTGKFEQIFGTYDLKTKEFTNSNLKAFEDSLPSHLKPVKITYKDGKSEPFRFQGKDENGKFTADPAKGLDVNTPSYEVEFGNGGKFIMVASPEYQTFHETISLEIPSGQKDGEELKQMQQILTVLGLGPIMGKQLQADDERQVLGLMLNMHFPQAWDQIQRDSSFYDLSPAQLKQKMIEIEPRMKEKFKNYEQHPELITKRQIFPGKEMYELGDISQEMEKAGIFGFFAGTGVDGAIAFMNSGVLSNDLKVRAMIHAKAGASEDADRRTGGSRSVFLRALNGPVSQNSISSGRFAFSNEVQVVYKTSVVNVGAVCYHSDQFGIRNKNYMKNKTFENRQSPLEFAKTLNHSIDKFPMNLSPEVYKMDYTQNEKGELIDNTTGQPLLDPSLGASNEVTVEGGNIPPEQIKELWVQSEEKKQELLLKMEEKGNLINILRNKNGIILNGTVVYGLKDNQIRTPMNEFIQVGDRFRNTSSKTATK